MKTLCTVVCFHFRGVFACTKSCKFRRPGAVGKTGMEGRAEQGGGGEEQGGSEVGGVVDGWGCETNRGGEEQEE